MSLFDEICIICSEVADEFRKILKDVKKFFDERQQKKYYLKGEAWADVLFIHDVPLDKIANFKYPEGGVPFKYTNSFRKGMIFKVSKIKSDFDDIAVARAKFERLKLQEKHSNGGYFEPTNQYDAEKSAAIKYSGQKAIDTLLKNINSGKPTKFLKGHFVLDSNGETIAEHYDIFVIDGRVKTRPPEKDD